MKGFAFARMLERLGYIIRDCVSARVIISNRAYRHRYPENVVGLY
jgi:hypothetical protein